MRKRGGGEVAREEAGWTQVVLDRRSDFVARRKTCDFKLTGSSFEPGSDPAPAPALALWHWSRRRAPPPTLCATHLPPSRSHTEISCTKRQRFSFSTF